MKTRRKKFNPHLIWENIKKIVPGDFPYTRMKDGLFEIETHWIRGNLTKLVIDNVDLSHTINNKIQHWLEEIREHSWIGSAKGKHLILTVFVKNGNLDDLDATINGKVIDASKITYKKNN